MGPGHEIAHQVGQVQSAHNYRVDSSHDIGMITAFELCIDVPSSRSAETTSSAAADPMMSLHENTESDNNMLTSKS